MILNSLCWLQEKWVCGGFFIFFFVCFSEALAQSSDERKRTAITIATIEIIHIYKTEIYLDWC